MIILGNALLALLSPPQEIQSTREESGFGTLLTAIEQHTTSLPDQEAAEHRALESVLQVLMSIFQSCTPANCLPMASAPGTGESGLVSMHPIEGLPLGLPPGRGIALTLWETAEVDLPPDMVSDGTQDMGQLTFPALHGQSPGPSPATTGAPLPATMPSSSRDGVLATAEAQFGSPGLPQTALATAGERHEAVRDTLPLPLSAFSTQTSVGNQDAWDGLSGSLLPLPPGSSLLQITPTAPLVGPAVAANTQPLSAGEEVFQSTSLTSQPSPVDAAPAVPWAGQVTAPPVAAPPLPLSTIPQADAVTTRDARGTIALAQEDTALPESDAPPAFGHLPESQAQAAETMPSVATLATDYALPLPSARATSHIPSAQPTIAVPPSHFLEDMGHPWPRPLPANTVVMHLEPRELGALLLRVRVHDKHLIASFQAQSPEAETLLRSHLLSLHESLSQHGFEVQPIAITRAAEGFSAHMGAGTGASTHQRSAFQAFAEDRQAANAGETQSEVDLHRTPRWPSEQRPRLLDVVI
jgi:Flagellar hook-length control protein FliK